MRNQTADAKYDWDWLVVLIAIEVAKLGQQPVSELTDDSAPANVQLPLVLATCRAIVHVKLKQLTENPSDISYMKLVGCEHGVASLLVA